MSSENYEGSDHLTVGPDALVEFKKRIEKTPDDDTPIILKAEGGDRAKNLEGIADALDNLIDNRLDYSGRFVTADQMEHIIKGYAEQLRICAAEIRE